MLLFHSEQLCEGHMDATLHIMVYLGLHNNSCLCTNPIYAASDIEDKQFPEMKWKEFYGDVKESIPPNAPKTLDKPVDVNIFVDSNHVNIQTRQPKRSIYIIIALVEWNSKCEAMIENGVLTLSLLQWKLIH